MPRGSKNKAIEARLAKQAKKWKKADPSEVQDFSEIPDGTYTARLREAVVEISRSDQLQITSRYEIARGDYKGRVVVRWDGLEREESMPYTKKFLECVGKDPETDISEMIGAL